MFLLASRGCSFLTKTIQAQNAGATAVIITDNDINNDADYIDMIQDETGRRAAIPAVYLLGKDGWGKCHTTYSHADLVIVLNIYWYSKVSHLNLAAFIFRYKYLF